jgi:hypothetical protein
VFQYRFEDKYMDLVREQVWETSHGLNVYSELSAKEFSQIGEHIRKPRVVFDICSGLGRASIYINHLLGDPSVLFILADRTGRTENTGAFNTPTDEVYNDLNLSLGFCELNGIEQVEAFDTEKDDWSTLPKVDLVISTVGLGFHVPIERYIDRLEAIASPQCRMIFGTRDKSYSPDSFRDRFPNSIWIKGTNEPPLPLEHWLILKK